MWPHLDSRISTLLSLERHELQPLSRYYHNKRRHNHLLHKSPNMKETQTQRAATISLRELRELTKLNEKTSKMKQQTPLTCLISFKISFPIPSYSSRVNQRYRWSFSQNISPTKQKNQGISQEMTLNIFPFRKYITADGHGQWRGKSRFAYF